MMILFDSLGTGRSKAEKSSQLARQILLKSRTELVGTNPCQTAIAGLDYLTEKSRLIRQTLKVPPH